MKHLMKFLRDEEGASAVEYGLIIGLIAVALIAVLSQLKGGLSSLFTTASNAATTAASSGTGS